MYLIDSSVFCSIFMDGDSNQERAIDLVEWIEEKIFVPYIIFAETVSVLIAKFSRERADEFVDYIMTDSRYIVMNTEIQQELAFWRATNKKLSYMDIIAIYNALQYNLELITFDDAMMKLYQKVKNA